MKRSRKYLLGVALLAVALAIIQVTLASLALTSAVAAQDERLELRLETAEAYIQNAPMVIALELRNAWDGTFYLGEMDRPFPMRLGHGGDPVTCRLVSVDGDREFILRGRDPVVRYHSLEPWNYPRFALAKGEQVRMLADLGDMPLAGGGREPFILPPGKYRLTVSYDPQGHDVRSNQVDFEISQMPQADREALLTIRQASARGWSRDTWLRRTGRAGDAAALGRFSDPVKETMRLYLFLRDIMHAKSLEDIAYDHLDAMEGTFLAPEAAAWRYELLAAKGEEVEAAELRAKLQEEHPGVVWRLKAIDQGKGELKSMVGAWRPKDQARPTPDN